jgi:voltage-gated sodium channel
LDKICLLIFIVELALKLVAYRFRFFTNWWNAFDTLVVAVSLVPSGGSFTVLRALRIFRVLRVNSRAPRLRCVVEGFITALPGMA